MPSSGRSPTTPPGRAAAAPRRSRSLSPPWKSGWQPRNVLNSLWQEIFLPESRKPDYKLVKEITVLCQKVRCCNLSGKERSKLLTEALRKMDGKYLEIAGSPVAASVLKVSW
uniref:Uncharacterized protein n=1 Tax=Aegilops tauschii subsp. strangulata TaxID=200361 RepID=A0A453PB95_AEGTS